MRARETKITAQELADVQKRSEILDRCLQAIAQKQVTIEGCARQYPEFEELRALLYAAQAVQNVRPELLSQMSKNGVRQRILEHYRARKPRHTVQGTIRNIPWFRPFAAFCAIVLILFVGGFELVKVSAAALPGDRLYGIKRAAENVQVALASEEARPNILANLAENRLSEISALAELHRTIPSWVVNDTAFAISTALDVQPDPTRRQQIYARTQLALQKIETMRAINPSIGETLLADLAANESNNGPVANSGAEPAPVLPVLGDPEATESQATTATSTPAPTAESPAKVTRAATDNPTQINEPTETAPPLPTFATANVEPTKRPDPTRAKPGTGRSSGFGLQPNGNRIGNPFISPDGNLNADNGPNGKAKGTGNDGGNGNGNPPDRSR